MPRNIVIIHGWSDQSKSFQTLRDLLSKELGAVTHVINLADWLSLDDDVTYRDLSVAMQRAWTQFGLPTAPRSVDVVVHSTGALVTRDWMTTHFTHDTVPIKRFLMLAPANFGSALAHKGHSFVARAYKGWGSGFQTGRHVLRGLELASPYTWELANRDRFTSPAQRWYGRDRILATVLIGNTGYSGISSIANERGSDGTVRISTANLNAMQIGLSFQKDSQTPVASVRSSAGAIAFGVIDRENHSTIVMKDRGPKNPITRDLIVRALKVDDGDFPATAVDPFAWQAEIDQVAPALATHNPGMQNTVVHLHDDLGQDIPDYFFEFYRALKGSDKVFEERFYKEVLGGRVHVYGPNPAFRCLYLDIDALQTIVQSFTVDPLYLSVAATPEYKPPKQPVGYCSFGEGDLGRYAIAGAALPRFFAPHRTVLIDIGIPRWISDKVFSIRTG